MKPHLSIRSKLFLSILLILCVSYSVLLFTTINSMSRFVEEQVNKDLGEHLGYARSQYYSRAELAKHSFLQPVQAPPVREHLVARDQEWLKDALQRWRNAIPFLDIITIIDNRKRVIARVNNDINNDRFELGYLLDKAVQEKKPVISTELVPHSLLVREGKTDLGLVNQKEGDAMMVTVAMPLFTPDGNLLGGIIAGEILNKGSHLPYMIRDVFGKEMELAITQGGIVIASSLKEQPPGSSLDTAILDRLQKGLPYWGRMETGDTSFRTVYEPIFNSSKEWVGALSVSIPEGEYLRVRKDNQRNILFSATIGIILSFGIAYITSKHLTQPLKAIAAGVENVEMGDLNQRLYVRTADEFGLLADAFNRMASALAERDGTIRRKTDALQELNELLENRVAERTIELRMEMGRLEAILTSMAEGIVVTNSDNQVILFNPAAQKILDIVPHRVFQQPIEQVCQAGNFCILFDLISKLRSDDSRFSGGEEEVTVKGKKLKVNVSSILDETGGFAGVVMSLRDVTLEEEVDRMKTEFISTVSHELKTPLTSMKGSLQFIMNKGKWLTGTERELLTVCLRNTERLIRLINDILDISKIEAGRIEFTMKPQSIGELVIYSIEEIKSFAMSRNISIVNCVGEEIPMVYGDHDRLVQVLTNLLSNSVKFSPAGQVVMVSATRQGNYVAISVADHGKVILWSDRDKLFKKFQQLDNTERGERGGTGLGLAICKEIVERHHGRIYYEMGAAGGNVFTFTVPVYEEQR
ncbi:ATP-binding protein [Geobacter sp. DSM 9736]|uniref:ATP-binding protein n=1 Tax=Geobacter sp. DSM 9736 TaxID=1277350 RepID=UPI000B4FEEB7|nr:ATP-binding protein [Geobacter sp. DSM 9736]SNB47273.1 PAS/PAC sensor signal transduction histidine kinase [Geobacter sp. DSM 9736]